MSARPLSVEWSEGASPEAMIEAFGETTLTVAVLEALLGDPELREKALAVMRGRDDELGALTR